MVGATLHAQSINQAIEGLDTAAGSGGAGFSMLDLPSTIGKIVGILLSFVGVLFFLLMIYGGIIWMTARGNEA